MNNELKTFVLLKYEILTSDTSTWERCEATYPVSVKSKWAWRCAADVEHLAKGHHTKQEECIRIAKLYRGGGKATIEELNKAWREFPHSAGGRRRAAVAAYYAVAITAYHATTITTTTASAIINREEKWAMYIGWLIEELCEYEKNQVKGIPTNE